MAVAHFLCKQKSMVLYEWVDGWMGGWMVGWMDGWMVEPGKGLLTAIKNPLFSSVKIVSTYSGGSISHINK